MKLYGRSIYFYSCYMQMILIYFIVLFIIVSFDLELVLYSTLVQYDIKWVYPT